MEKLIIFAKAPRPGEVKTRLAAEIGTDRALQVYLELLRAQFSNLRALSAEVHFSPIDGAKCLEPLTPQGWKLVPQQGNELGERLIHAFQNSFDQGAKRVVIIGSDCPDVQPTHVQEAWRSLKKHDLVVGPATDGGYWLIGLSSPQPVLFQQIAWSSAEVLAQTMAKAASLKLRIDLLEILSDIDSKKDWNEYLRRQRQPSVANG